MHMNSIFVVKLTWEDSGMNINFLEKKLILKNYRAQHIPLLDSPGQEKKSIKEVDLDKFSSDSYVNSYWKKKYQILEFGQEKILRNGELLNKEKFLATHNILTDVYK